MPIELFEREAELAVIEELIEAAAKGRESLLVIEGPAGIGKTELLASARRRAEAAGLRVLSARGAEIERSFPFGVVRQLLEPPLARASAAQRRRLLSGAASLAEPVLGRAPDGGGTGEVFAAMHGLYWLAAGLAERAALLASVDDAQWADADSLRWLGYLARRLEGTAIVIAVAVRSGEPGTERNLLAELAAYPAARRVVPAPLGKAAVRELVRARLGAEADGEFCAACGEATGGNPFMLHELIAELDHDRVEARAAAAPRVRALGPETVSRSVLLRIARMPPGAAALARAAAVLEPGCELRHAAALADLDNDTATVAADALTTGGIFAPGRPLDFVHPIVRGSIREEAPEAARRRLHARAARLLADDGARADRVAAHLLAAEPAADPWVAAALRAAADEAMSRSAPDVAALYLRRALREPPARTDRPSVLRRLVTASFRAGDVSLVDDQLDDALCELVADGTGTPDAHVLELSTLLIGAGRPDEGTELLDRAARRARDLGDATLAFRLEAELVNWLQLAPAAARGRLEPYAEGLEPGTPAAATLNALRAWWHTMIGDADAAQTARLARAALAGIGPDRGDHPSLTEAQAILALVRADRWQDATEAIAPRIDDARRRGSALAFVGMRWLEAYLAFAQGRVSDAVADARESIESARAGGYLVAFPFYSALLIEALVEADDLDAAETELVQTGMTGEMPDLYWLGPLLFARGRLRLAQARTDEGLEDLLEMGRRFDRDGMQDLTGCPWAATAAPVLAGRGERDRARALTQEELSRARRWGAPSAVGRSLRALALVEGGDRGIELLGEAEAALEGSGAELVRAYVLADLGAALRRRGNRAAARDPLRRALDIAHRAGATRLATRAREELAATGARPRKLVLRGVDSLTPSELRAARMAADGLSNREIAQALFVTINTVETHLRHAYQKLAIKRREQLADALHAHPGDPKRG